MRDIARFVLVSPDVLVWLGVVALWLLSPPELAEFGRLLQESEKTLTHATVSAPTLLGGLVATMSWKALYPAEGIKALLDWSGYKHLKHRVIYSGALAFMYFSGAVLVRFVHSKLTSFQVGLAVLTSLVGLVVVLPPLVLASMKMREAAEKLAPDPE